MRQGKHGVASQSRLGIALESTLCKAREHKGCGTYCYASALLSLQSCAKRKSEAGHKEKRIGCRSESWQPGTLELEGQYKRGTNTLCGKGREEEYSSSKRHDTENSEERKQRKTGSTGLTERGRYAGSLSSSYAWHGAYRHATVRPPGERSEEEPAACMSPGMPGNTITAVKNKVTLADMTSDITNTQTPTDAPRCSNFCSRKGAARGLETDKWGPW